MAEPTPAQRYTHTKKGLTTHIYLMQKASCKKCNNPIPTYTALELRGWLFNQLLFHHLYTLWVTSGYDKWQKPSVNRLNDYISYTLNNIELTTRRGNMNKYHEDVRLGVNKKTSKAINQYTKQGKFIATYRSLTVAQVATGIHNAHISKVCHSIRKTAGGYIWKFK